MNPKHLSVLLVLCLGSIAGFDANRSAQEEKIRPIKAKFFREEPLTPAENEVSKKYFADRQEESKKFAENTPPLDSIGLIPLTDLGQKQYRGEQGGLYPGGHNSPPAKHLQGGLKLAGEIKPRDREGAVSKDGKIVFISIGMSNTTNSFSVFVKHAAADSELNPQLVVVDCAQGGRSADATADPKAAYWRIAVERLEKAGVTRNQVQAAWVKQAVPQPFRTFPEEPRLIQGYLKETVQNLARFFPHLKIVYLSSRTYGGYARSTLNPEPHAYEGGFAVKWLIASQIADDPELNYDPAKGPVRSPWLAWGPYLWSDGLKGRSDGLTYAASDFNSDGTHPSQQGREKVSRQLLSFLKRDQTSRPWFVGQSENRR
ncbi:MAG: hypothetical protein L0Z46_09090 [Nitrospiraceae bacterium]|nr:hypothetical protein [Nitrospiraceae bacterium]